MPGLSASGNSWTRKALRGQRTKRHEVVSESHVCWGGDSRMPQPPWLIPDKTRISDLGRRCRDVYLVYTKPETKRRVGVLELPSSIYTLPLMRKFIHGLAPC